MASTPNRYKALERYMTITLCIDAVSFLLYLIFSGMGILWLKIVLAIMCFLMSGYLLWILYAAKELFRQRSLWITTGAIAIIVCLLVSLCLNYPSPDPTKTITETADLFTYRV